MFDESTICPYTGLRAFSEEESIFFKGRDTQINQITGLLEKNKFLMVTGASGEGKSSLVYGGMIPNARAGFFKATYNNWQVVDFRPERTPLKNFAKNLAAKLGYSDQTSVYTELERGYSALVDIYRNSLWYYDEDDAQWQEKSDADKVTSKREASNLLIIVDQFEEFFTNPENYINGTPSEPSQVVLNLLLETSKIALEQNLPIYVVCTMRSDYIGQCSAFRGLPEAIGFSQFFVPRLKRNELKLIIEEPALLNGNSISQRLVERLLYDLSEGIDQLPILQHALSHIWHAANNGKEELDLIHYALVGGMPASDLPDEDKPRFLSWFKSLPEYQRQLYHSPGIKRVIEIHANQLYEGAYTYLKNKRPSNQLSLYEVKQVVALSFACLTKIDDSRAVRNRMTLEEITGIINKPHITHDVVNDILNIFREQDNSFVRPFISEDPESSIIKTDTVLDITHESLIRNWGLLNKWANKEYEYYTTFQDFRKQLNRWLESGKSKSYLLPLGPLSYFENWENECKPNKFWINRYEENNGVWPNNLDEAGELLNEAHEFLNKSNRKVLVARTFMKYGANRIAATVSVLLVLFLSSFYFIDAQNKSDENIVKSVLAQGTELLSSKAIIPRDKATFLILKEEYEPGSMLNYLKSVDGATPQLSLAINSYSEILNIDKKDKSPLKSELKQFLSEALLQSNFEESNLTEYLGLMMQLTTTLSYDYYYNSESTTIDFLKELNTKIYRSLLDGLANNEEIPPEYLNRSVQFYLSFNNPPSEEIRELIRLISPFESIESSKIFNSIYPFDGIIRNGRIDMRHNAGYHTIASLYAVIGDSDHLLQAMDSLKINKDYFVSLPLNGPANILGYLYQYDHQNIINNYVNYWADVSDYSRVEIYKDLIDRSGYLKHLFSTNINANISESNAGYFGPNLIFLLPEKLAAIFAACEKEINQIDNINARSYELAILAKQRGLFRHKYLYDKELPIDTAEINTYFEQFVEFTSKIDNDYLDEITSLTYRYYGGGLRQKQDTRKNILIYPDYIGGYFSDTYHSALLFDYLFKNDLLANYYQSISDLELFNYWVANAYETYSFPDEEAFKNQIELTHRQLEQIRDFVNQHPRKNTFDLNLVNLILANIYFELGDTEAALSATGALDVDKYPQSSKKFEYLNEAFFLNEVSQLANNLAKIGEIELAYQQIGSFKRVPHRIEAYFLGAIALYKDDYNPMAFVFLDSAYQLRKNVKEQELNFDEDYRFNLIRAMSIIGGKRNELLINEAIKSLNEVFHPFMVELKVFGYAEGGNYYSAYSSIGSDLTENGELLCASFVLIGHSYSENPDGLGRKMINSFFPFSYRFNMRNL